MSALLTFLPLKVLDFGAARDGVPANDRGRRVVVDLKGKEIEDVEPAVQADAGAAADA